MKILLFGATGSAGSGVLEARLSTERVDEVVRFTRRPLQRDHPKLRVFVHSDFTDCTSVSDAFVVIASSVSEFPPHKFAESSTEGGSLTTTRWPRPAW